MSKVIGEIHNADCLCDLCIDRWNKDMRKFVIKNGPQLFDKTLWFLKENYQLVYDDEIEEDWQIENIETNCPNCYAYKNKVDEIDRRIIKNHWDSLNEA